MRNALPYLFCLGVLLSGCMSTDVKDNILTPLAAKIFEHILPQIELGLIDGVEDGDLNQEAADYLLAEAYKLRDYLNAGETSMGDWSILEPWAARGVASMIEDGTISPGVATSLYQRIVNFRDLLHELNALVSWINARPRYSTTETVGGDPVFLGYQPKVSF